MHHMIPQDWFKVVTQIRFICNVHTEKKEPKRACTIICRERTNSPDDVVQQQQTCSLSKKFLNSIISTLGAQVANADISNFYIITPLKGPEFAKVRLIFLKKF